MKGTTIHLKEDSLLQGGKYRIVRFINSGGFGCTYEAEHMMLCKRVAIKEFFVKDFCGRDERTAYVTIETTNKKDLVEKLKKKFIEEARSIFELHHPGIVRVTDVFEENDTAYYVMDYIEGKSLKEIVDNEGALPESRALGYIRQVSDALNYVHAHNRLHLDIKPGNIMIDGNDRAILIDFGTSKQYDEVNGGNTSTLLGQTPGYAPLEQVGNDLMKFTPATDIYSLGATFYCLLQGTRPPEANVVLNEGLPEFNAKIRNSIRKAIKNSMCPELRNRPQIVNDFLMSLENSFEIREYPYTFFNFCVKNQGLVKCFLCAILFVLFGLRINHLISINAFWEERWMADIIYLPIAFAVSFVSICNIFRISKLNFWYTNIINIVMLTVVWLSTWWLYTTDCNLGDMQEYFPLWLTLVYIFMATSYKTTDYIRKGVLMIAYSGLIMYTFGFILCS